MLVACAGRRSGALLSARSLQEQARQADAPAKGPAHHHMYAWQDVPSRHDCAPPRPVGGQHEQGLGQRLHADRAAWSSARSTTARRGRTSARPALRDAPVPRHRGVRRRTTRSSCRRERDPTPHLPHRRRRPDLDARLPERRAERLLRLHDVLQPQGRPRGLRSAGRGAVPRSSRRRTGDARGTSSTRPGCLRRCPASSPSQPAGSASTSNHGRTAWLGTGGGAQARVFTSRNRGADVDRGVDADAQRAERGDLRARLQRASGTGSQSAATSPRRRPRRTTSPSRTRWPELGAADRRTGRVPLRRDLGRRPHGNRRRPVRQRLQQRTAATRGRASTTAASTRSTVRARRLAGPQARTAESRISRARQRDSFDLDQLALVAERCDSEQRAGRPGRRKSLLDHRPDPDELRTVG